MEEIHKRTRRGSADTWYRRITDGSAFCKSILLFTPTLGYILCLSFAICAGSVRHAYATMDNRPEETLKLESGFYYTVEKRDTLWDISERFYDYAWLWPDLWKKNPHIKNPHLIFPGERIRLFSRRELKAKLEGVEEVPIPVEPAYYLYPAIDSVGFIREKAVHSSGGIFKIKQTEKAMMGAERDWVYLRPAGGTVFEVGDRFKIFRTFRPVSRAKKEASVMGVQHCIIGVVEITDVEPRFSIGRIVKSFQPIEVHDLLMPYEALSPEIMLTESQEGLEGKIIISEKHQELIGDRDIVFIDRGRQDGVRPGQLYSVYHQERAYLDPEGKESVLLSPVDIGEILILRTEETSATAIVTMSDEAISPGQRIRDTSHLHLLTAESPDLYAPAED